MEIACHCSFLSFYSSPAYNFLFYSEGLGKCFGFFPTLCCHSIPVFAACYCSSRSVSGIHLPCGSYFPHSARILIPAWSVPLKWWPQPGLDVGLLWAVKLLQWILDSFLSVLLWLSMWVWVPPCFIPTCVLQVHWLWTLYLLVQWELSIVGVLHWVYTTC